MAKSSQNKKQAIPIKPQIVHESEAQRQYVRMPIPARAELQGQNYTVKDLSSGGLGIAGIEGAFKSGETLHLNLEFPFTGFTLDTHLQAQVQNYDPKLKLLGVRFINLNPAQISMINHVIRAFVSGDLVSAEDVLDVAGRNDFVRLRNESGKSTYTKPHIFKNAALLFIIALLGFAALSMIAANLYQGLFVVTAHSGVIKAPTTAMKSPASGTYIQKMGASGFQVQKDQVIATIKFPGLNLYEDGGFELKSPCDCFVLERYVNEGEYVEQGAKILDLVRVQAAAYAEIFMDPQKAARLRIGDKAEMRLVGMDTTINGQITDIQFDESAGSNATNGLPLTKIIVTPDQKLPFDYLGRPITTSFSLF